MILLNCLIARALEKIGQEQEFESLEKVRTVQEEIEKLNTKRRAAGSRKKA